MGQASVVPRSIILSLLTFAAALFLADYRAYAEDPEVEILALPASVAVPTVGEIQTTAIVRNPTDSVLSNVQLSWFNNDGFCLALTGSQCRPDGGNQTSQVSLVAGGETSWALTISRLDSRTIGGTIYLQLDYDEQRADRSLAHRVRNATIAVTFLAPPALKTTTTIDLKTANTQFNEYRPSRIFATITNTSEDWIVVTSLVVQGPSFVVGTDTQPNLYIRPHDLVVFSFDVSVAADKGIRPGKHTFLVKAEIWRPR